MIYFVKMANKIEKPPTEIAMEKKAELIGHKLEELKRKCATEAEKVSCFINANLIHFEHWNQVNAIRQMT